MKTRILTGILCGLIAGLLDLIPMFIQHLTWDANLAALSMWIISGFFISTISLEMNTVLKGIMVSLLCLAPCSFIIGWYDPVSLIPITLMTIVLGGFLGFAINKIYIVVTQGHSGN